MDVQSLLSPNMLAKFEKMTTKEDSNNNALTPSKKRYNTRQVH